MAKRNGSSVIPEEPFSGLPENDLMSEGYFPN